MSLYPRLNARLLACAELMEGASAGADIGADHGKLGVFLLMRNPHMRMIISDISPAALSRAEGLIHMHHLESRAQLICADGLQALASASLYVDCICIAGMGGQTIERILIEGQRYLRHASLVLSSHTDIQFVRSTVSEIGYHLCEERLVRYHHRFYVIMRAEEGPAAYTEEQLLIGPCLMQNKPEGLYEYLTWKLSVYGRQRDAEGIRCCELIQRYLQEAGVPPPVY